MDGQTDTHLLVGQDNQGQLGLCSQQCMQLLAHCQQAGPVHRVHHEHQHVGLAQVAGPVRSQVLAAPHCRRGAGSGIGMGVSGAAISL